MGATDRETLSRILADAPKAWGQWAARDEIGALNYLTRVEVKSGVDAIRQHRAFTLGVPVGAAAGDLIFPGRWPARHYMVADKAGFEAGHWQALAGGLEFADDYVSGFALGRNALRCARTHVVRGHALERVSGLIDKWRNDQGEHRADRAPRNCRSRGSPLIWRASAASRAWSER